MAQYIQRSFPLESRKYRALRRRTAVLQTPGRIPRRTGHAEKGEAPGPTSAPRRSTPTAGCGRAARESVSPHGDRASAPSESAVIAHTGTKQALRPRRINEEKANTPSECWPSLHTGTKSHSVQDTVPAKGPSVREQQPQSPAAHGPHVLPSAAHPPRPRPLLPVPGPKEGRARLPARLYASLTP